jgi:hypothetical protein
MWRKKNVLLKTVWEHIKTPNIQRKLLFNNEIGYAHTK